MKVSVTALKAPWPDGVKVGDVVDLGCDSLPPWAVGKCVPAADDAEVTAVVEAPAPAPAAVSEDEAKIATALAEAEAQAAAERKTKGRTKG